MNKRTMGIVALESKAESVRRIAHDLGISYAESVDANEPGTIRFTFELTEEKMLRLLDQVPRDVYARRAYL